MTTIDFKELSALKKEVDKKRHEEAILYLSELLEEKEISERAIKDLQAIIFLGVKVEDYSRVVVTNKKIISLLHLVEILESIHQL